MYYLRKLGRFNHMRYYSTSLGKNIVTPLTNRAILKLSGLDVYDYLQGLVTNDMKHLELGSGSMYSMFLNTKGRVLFDAIIYKSHKVDTLLIDCDSKIIDALEKHLKVYRLRRKVDISVENLDVFAFYDRTVIERLGAPLVDANLDGLIFPCDKLSATANRDKSSRTYKDLIVYNDPRISLLGSRILAPKGADVSSILSELSPLQLDPELKNYRWFRYNLGVGEGVDDLPVNNSFPLECNCDYLHGVSFHKGCYIGQELTARTHHTGVVRKRLMPIFFDKPPSALPEKEGINHEKGSLGKLRGIEGNVGLGLLRIASVLDLKEFAVGDGIGRTLRPSWWPIELSKERVTSQKN